VVVVVVVAVVVTAWKRKKELHGEILVEKCLQRKPPIKPRSRWKDRMNEIVVKYTAVI